MIVSELARGRAVDNLIQPFQVEGANLRGRVVRLGSVVDAILGRHDYPDAVSTMLGEALALTATLAGALKFDGIFTLQTKGDGPIGTLVADYRTPGDLRGYAGYNREAFAENGRAAAKPGAGSPVPRLLGAGYLAFTVDQGPETERYQGIVELTGATLSDCAHKYFQQSEQLEAGIRLAVARVRDDAGDEHWRAGGIMIQRLPQYGFDNEASEDAWRRALALMGSARDDELCDPALPAVELLYRLFHEDGVRVYQPTPLIDSCRCSRERVHGVLMSFPPQDIADMVVDGKVVATCEFCNTAYSFQPDELLPDK